MKAKTQARLIALAILAWGPAEATDFYVDNQATGGNTGANWTDAYTSFTEAVSNVWGSGANTGATIYVRQALGAPDYGVGAGLVLGPGFADGAPEAYNRIVGWTGEGFAERPLLVRTNQGAVIDLGVVNQTSRQCYEFRNLSFKGKDLWFSSSVRLCYQSSNVRFLENVCTNASFRADDGTSTPSKTNVLIQANTFGSGSVCSFRVAADIQIIDNQMIVRAGTSSAISLGYANDRVLIRGNTIECGDCISAQSTDDVIIERNRMKASYRAAIFSDNYPDRWVIRNNIFHDITGSHASWPEGRGLDIFRNSSLVVVNNTFHQFPETGAIAVKLGPSVRNAVVFNNIISGVSSGIVAVADCTLTNDVNAFWNVDNRQSGVAVAGPNDRLADPMFKAPAAYDFRLGNVDLMASAAKSFAEESAPADDFFGTARGKGISFGAIQSPLHATVLVLR